MFFPYLTGDWSSANFQWNIGSGGGLALAITWLYFMCWSAYGFEAVAAFAPEYHDTETDTPKALRASALFCVASTRCCRSGSAARSAPGGRRRPDFMLLHEGFDAIVGNALGNVMIFCLVAGLILSMNTATMDGSRALFGISRDGMTIKQLGVLNKLQRAGARDDARHGAQPVPAELFRRARSRSSPREHRLHVRHVFALSGFLLLRRDRPDWPRPFRLPRLAADRRRARADQPVFIIVGGFICSGGFLGITGYGYGWDKTRIGLLVLLAALLLYAWRHIVQDHTGIRLREETPTRPEEEEAPPVAPMPATP